MLNLNSSSNNSNQKSSSYYYDITFNADYSCLAIGCADGFKIFTVVPFALRIFRPIEGGVGMVEILENSNIIGFVGSGTNFKFPSNSLILWDDSTTKIIHRFNCQTAITNFKLTFQYIIIATINKIFIYNINNYKLVDTLTTFKNQTGLCSINNYPLNNEYFIAYISQNGMLKIRNIATTKEKLVRYSPNFIITNPRACPIAYMSLNKEGSLLALVNNEGTYISIHETENCTHLYDLYRGRETAIINYLSFNIHNNLLACTSDRGTIHIWVISKNKELIQNDSGGLFSFMNKTTIVKSVAKHKVDTSNWVCGYVDGTDILISLNNEGEYNFAHIHTNENGYCKVISTNTLPK
jgi:autophagy-related protein 18